MLAIIRQLYDTLRAGRTAALATVIFQSGSAPRGAGSRLIADEHGLIAGTTGGGLAEARAIAACATACRTQHAQLLEIAMDGSLAAQSDMICGGRVSVLIEPFSPDNIPLLQLVEKALLLAKTDSCRIIRLCPPEHTKWTLLYPDGQQEGAPLSASICTALLRTTAAEACLYNLEGQQYYVEQCCRQERMILVGGGHVSRPTASIASLAHFDVHVLDDREEYANPQRFPSATCHVLPSYDACFDTLHVGIRDYIVIVTRGHLYDGNAVAQALRTPATYIGMIGSQRKKEQIFTSLYEQGFSSTDIARIHSPIGLKIGAETPEEIAVSILAECIAHRHGVEKSQSLCADLPSHT